MATAALALSVAGCGRSALGEAEDPGPVGRLLASRRVEANYEPEVLRASIEVFGLQIGTLQSSLCPDANGLASIQTRMEASPLVNVIRHTSGEGRTELGELSGSPRSSDYTFRDGGIVRHYRVEYRTGAYDYVYDNGGPERRVGQSSVPDGAEAHDLQSAVMLLRAWRPRLGELAHFFVVLGRKPWRVDVTSAGPEVIKVGGGPRLTHRIDGVGVRLWESPDSTPKRFSLWLSEDADRAPLRMVADASFGEVTMTLMERVEGNAACAPVAELGANEPEPTPAAVAEERVGRIGRAWRSPDLVPPAERAPQPE